MGDMRTHCSAYTVAYTSARGEEERGCEGEIGKRIAPHIPWRRDEERIGEEERRGEEERGDR